MRRISALALALFLVLSIRSVAPGQGQPAGDTAAAPATTTIDNYDDGTNWGWLGLLGLAGLLGLRRREPNTVSTTRTASATR